MLRPRRFAVYLWSVNKLKFLEKERLAQSNKSSHVATPPRPTSLPTSSSSSERHSVLPVEVSRALAALRCLPCLVGSFVPAEQGARREAVGRPFGLIEELLAACPMACGDPAASMKRTSSSIQGEKLDTIVDGDSGRSRKRGKGKGGKTNAVVKEARGGGGEILDGDEHHDEVVVLRAYALEAGVGLCCLLPGDDEGGLAGREETLGRLLQWHER